MCSLTLISFSSGPPQNVMDDFVCALKKRILLQGRMYVFEHYVCFHSNVLGYVKNKIIPLKVMILATCARHLARADESWLCCNLLWTQMGRSVALQMGQISVSSSGSPARLPGARWQRIGNRSAEQNRSILRSAVIYAMNGFS